MHLSQTIQSVQAAPFLDKVLHRAPGIEIQAMVILLEVYLPFFASRAVCTCAAGQLA